VAQRLITPTLRIGSAVAPRDAEGTVDRRDGQMRFSEIVLRPRLLVPAASERERALRAIEKAEKTCLVSASLATPIRLEPEIAKEP
jgi:organic hydroperoxide reductase OsmC/OhrA